MKQWRLEQLTKRKARADLDPATAWFVLAWDAFKAPEFPFDEALRLARVCGLDLDGEVVGRLAEKKGSDLILWDSAKRAAKGSLGAADGSRAMIDPLHHAAHAGRQRTVAAARELVEKAGVADDPGFLTALEAVLEVLPVSKAFTGIEEPAGLRCRSRQQLRRARKAPPPGVHRPGRCAEAAGAVEGGGRSMTFERLPDLKWLGKGVLKARVPIASLPDVLPSFQRIPFAIGQCENAYLETIVREPFLGDSRQIPVATVSKKYALVQHVELAQQIRKALEDKNGAISCDHDAEMMLSEYGERFFSTMQLASSTLDPADGWPLILRLTVFNSVDGSCPLQLSLRWLRQICTNGMTVLRKRQRLSEVHRVDRISAVSIRKFCSERVPKAIESEKNMFSQWLKTKLEKNIFHAWLNKDVVKTWGTQAAARLFHICKTGFDGRVEKNKKVLSPLDMFVSSDIIVPSSGAPVENLYHLYQALTWLSDHRETMEDRERRGEQALALIKSLERRLKTS